MTKKQSVIFKLIILLVGIGVIGLAYYLFGPKGEEVTAIQQYLWINIFILYVVLFTPMVFSTISSNNVSSKIPNLTLGIGSIVGFEILNIIFTVLVYKEKVSLKAAILIEAISFFVLLIMLYLTYFASGHIAQTEKEVEQSLSLIKNIRSSMQLLSLKADSMGPAYAADAKTIKALEEEVRWMAPQNTTASVALEGQIMGKIDAVSTAIDAIQTGADNLNFKSQLTNLDTLIKQRKMLVK